MKKVDIVIIGAGIAGLTCAIYLKRANANFEILEGDMVGGKLTKIGKVDNYPGFPSSSGLEIFKSLNKQINDLDIVATYGKVQSVNKTSDGFLVISDVDKYECKAVVVASGTIIKGSGVTGEKEFEGRGVSYCATCDGGFFKSLPVALIGSSEIAFEEALYLANLASEVHLVCTSLDNVSPQTQKRVEEKSNIIIHKGFELKTIIGDEFVESIDINDKTKTENIKVKGVFPLLGFKSSNQFLTELKLNTRNGYIVVDDMMMSSVDGLFAIGDVVAKSVKQLVTAASDGAIVSSFLLKYMRSH